LPNTPYQACSHAPTILPHLPNMGHIRGMIYATKSIAAALIRICRRHRRHPARRRHQQLRAVHTGRSR
ncbi:MAG: hypothetical protein ACLR20_10075, partial [Bifidobacterium longum]